MVKDLNLPPLRGTDPRSIQNWAREVSTVFNEVIRNLVNPGFYTWDKGCLNINTSTTIAGANELYFESPVTGHGTLLITGVGFQGASLAINDVTLATTLSNTDTTAAIGYEAAITNLAEGDNTFKIWDAGANGGEMRKLEIRGLDVGGFRGFGALANQGTLNAGVKQYDVGDAATRRIGKGVAFVVANDGDSIVFDPARGEIPSINYLWGGAENPTGTALTGAAWYKDINFLNTTTSGFDVSAKFKAPASAPTNVSDTTSTGDSSAWIIEKSATAEDNDDIYTYQFDVLVNAATLTGPPGDETILDSTVTVALDTRTTALGAWTERASYVYTNSNTAGTKTFSNEIKNVTVDGLGVDAAFRVRVKATFNGGGNIPAFDSVSYSHGGSGAATETMTPGNGEPQILIMVAGGIEETVS